MESSRSGYNAIVRLITSKSCLGTEEGLNGIYKEVGQTEETNGVDRNGPTRIISAIGISIIVG
ncbi:hypothetical protein JHK85_012618 [Glycine max]|nr:hypothetical protein JHK85_012618 [Glycine max]